MQAIVIYLILPSLAGVLAHVICKLIDKYL